MTRAKDGQIHLLHNRCPHRGNRVCDRHRGNARSFTCNYHGWTFGNDGSLRGYPFPSGYATDQRQTYGLVVVDQEAAITRFVEENYGKLRARNTRARRVDSGSYYAGETKGRTIQINRPLTGGQS